MITKLRASHEIVVSEMAVSFVASVSGECVVAFNSVPSL